MMKDPITFRRVARIDVGDSVSYSFSVPRRPALGWARENHRTL